MHIEQLIDFGKTRIENLKFRTDLQDPVEPFYSHTLLYGATQQNIFSLQISHSMLIEQIINLRKVKTGNLKFRTDLEIYYRSLRLSY